MDLGSLCSRSVWSAEQAEEEQELNKGTLSQKKSKQTNKYVFKTRKETFKKIVNDMLIICYINYSVCFGGYSFLQKNLSF